MGKIILVTEKYVYIDERNVYYKISKELFTFKPKINSNIKVLKKSDGTILNIIPIKIKNKTVIDNLDKHLLKTLHLYTFVFSLIIITLISDSIHMGKDYFSTVFFVSFFLIVLSLFKMLFKTTLMNKIYFKITLVFYFILLVIAVGLLVRKNYLVGLIILILSAVPLVFNIRACKIFKELEIPPDKLFMGVL